MYRCNRLCTCKFIIIQKSWKILDFKQPPKESVQNGIASGDWSMVEFPFAGSPVHSFSGVIWCSLCVFIKNLFFSLRTDVILPFLFHGPGPPVEGLVALGGEQLLQGPKHWPLYCLHSVVDSHRFQYFPYYKSLYEWGHSSLSCSPIAAT